ncbi:MAB_1171c family putative transporter [Streptomyces sp. NPDC097619]|uniref:MAB_1171c family putative transporter n=1 Tax=Streptomyces sp. NPDC097619 TaxID=3157228 RepID=UPI003318DF8C
MTIEDLYIPYVIPASVLVIAFAIKAPAMMRYWRNPLLRAVGGLLLVAAAVFVFAYPPMIAWVNQLVGIPNVAAPWVYSILTIYCGSCLVLMIYWRGGDQATVKRFIWTVVSAYSTVIISYWVLFAFADVPVERLRDLDTYYATTPYMRELIMLYLVAHSVACSASLVLCWTWLRRVDGLLRTGLRLQVIGYILNLCYDGVKYTAIGARWFGGNLDTLSTNVAPPLACLCAIFIAVGFILPHAGQGILLSWEERRQYRQLGPLWQELRAVQPNIASVRLPLRAPINLRLVQRRSDIGDALLNLGAHFDSNLRGEVFAEQIRLDHGDAEAAAVADAAAILAAVASIRAEAPMPIGDGMSNTHRLSLDLPAISQAIPRARTIQKARDHMHSGTHEEVAAR